MGLFICLLFNDILTYVGYFMPSAILVAEQLWPRAKGYKAVPNFPNAIFPKVNAIEWLEFEIAY